MSTSIIDDVTLRPLRGIGRRRGAGGAARAGVAGLGGFIVWRRRARRRRVPRWSRSGGLR